MSAPDTAAEVPVKLNRGGTHTHRNPACPCNACKARRRTAQAELGPAGDGGALVVSDAPQGTIEADLPLVGLDPTSHRARIAGWLAMRAAEPGLTTKEIAKRMGLSPHTMYSLIYRAQKAGWLKFDDPMAKLEYQVIPKAVENLQKFLNEGDKAVTIEVAKGTIFKTYQAAQGVVEGTTQTILAIKFEQPTGEMVKTVTAEVVGRSRIEDDEDAVQE